MERLAKKEDFERVRRTGERWRGKYCVLNAARAPADESQASLTRVGYITTRSIGKAVKRNRARRLLREAMRQLSDSVAPGWDIVLIAQPAIIRESARMQQVREELLWLLNRAHLIQAAPTER